MSQKETWKATFYRASADGATVAYTQVAITAVAGYTSNASTTCYITKPQKTKLFESERLTDVSGWETGTLSLRDVFAVELYPYKYDDSATRPDLTDWEALASWLVAEDYLWVSITGGSRSYPADTTKCHPVNIESVSESVNAQAGTHGVTVNLRVKGTL